ncbi:MAG: hypothetical protein RLZZ436_1900 [Planctomycetota bacterium]
MKDARMTAHLFRIRLLLMLTFGLLTLTSGCSEYKPAGPPESDPQKVDKPGDQQG